MLRMERFSSLNQEVVVERIANFCWRKRLADLGGVAFK